MPHFKWIKCKHCGYEQSDRGKPCIFCNTDEEGKVHYPIYERASPKTLCDKCGMTYNQHGRRLFGKLKLAYVCGSWYKL